ncbi:uncharacterized protein LOC118408466 [Branchiostoma floridae]|uniref:Uncharacterized protein LOC118408466 n=1 Tax=Branchiostoma floridae TaxID=7739 RepID=A0A9J7HWQ7_BRAFL|nr:uncharacterized protein LOC118408466 [Branchiostoma floridae]
MVSPPISRNSGFTYIKHRKLTQDRHLYLPDQIHLDPRSGTKLLVADVKRTLNASPPTPTAGPPQLPTPRPQRGYRSSDQHAHPRPQTAATKRDNAIPTRDWFKNSVNAIPLGSRKPVSPASLTSNRNPTTGSRPGGTQQVVTSPITTGSRSNGTLQVPTSPIATLQLRPTKQTVLQWKQIGKRFRKAWDILTS